MCWAPRTPHQDKLVLTGGGVVRRLSNFLALDVGGTRIGVASASSVARLPSPLTTLANSSTVYQEIANLCLSEQAGTVVVGLPRSLDGNDTAQTAATRQFAADFQLVAPDLKIVWQDEALTSVRAKQELADRGRAFAKGDIDALAATYILEDYFLQNGETNA